MFSTQLSPWKRQRSLDELARGNTVDVLVIGGGITGAGAALDAASRGLTVALVEAEDFASGSSSMSSKLLHGGLRYLAQLDVGLAHAAMTERSRLVDTIAPHLITQVPFIFPFKNGFSEELFIASGVTLYDVLSYSPGVRRVFPVHRRLGNRLLREHFESLDTENYRRGLRYFDGQIDDARLVLTVMRTAAGHGAHLLNRVRATSFLTDKGRVHGIGALDRESGRKVHIHARHTIIAAGPDSAAVQALPGMPRVVSTGSESPAGLDVRSTTGTHIVVEGPAITGRTGLVARVDASLLMIVPWDGRWLIGTTNTANSAQPDRDHPAEEDIQALVERANAVLRRPLTREHVVAAFAGRHTWVAPDSEAPARSIVSREHALAHPAPGATTVAGGRLTTYRLAAADAVDAALGPARAAETPSHTATLPLVGAAGYHVRVRQRQRLSNRYGWQEPRLRHLLGRYGDALDDLVGLLDERPELGLPLTNAPEYLAAEVVYAARFEGALHLDDVLMRRTRISAQFRRGGQDVAQEVAEILGAELGWSRGEQDGELAAYTARFGA